LLNRHINRTDYLGIVKILLFITNPQKKTYYVVKFENKALKVYI